MNDDIKIDAEFKESDHPRAEDGKFGSGGGKDSSSEKPPVISTLNPTGSIFAEYTPAQRMKAELAPNITTLDKTSGENPNTVITIYRGVPKGSGAKIQGGDFVTTNKQLAKDYAGDGDVISQEVKMSDILDDEDEPLGEEYLYRPKQGDDKADALDMPLAQEPNAEIVPAVETISDDLSIAEKMAAGEIDQIVATDKCLLVPMRITGTGITERTMKDANGITIKYPIDRPADVFLSDRFLQMCNGLPVCFYHPQDGEGFTSLNFDNWKEHVVGTIFYPYIKGTEVWGVAKVFDLSMLDAFRDGIASTSPFVTSQNEIGDGVYVEKLEDINHVAIVPAGHWDTDQPAITANKEIQMKEDLMADKENPVAEADKKADADVTQVNPAETVKKPDAEAPQALAGDDQPAEDARFGKLEAAVASLTEGMAAIKGSLDALVASDKEVHENIDADPVVGEDEEKKAGVVNALTEMADAAHAEVKIVKPVPVNGESVPEFKRRILAHNVALVDPAFAGLVKVKADSAIEPLLDKGIESIGVNAKKKSDELYKAASSTKNARVVLKDGVTCIPNF